MFVRNTIKNILSIFIMFSLIGCAEKNENANRFDEDGMVIIKGERTFIIGSYYMPKTDTPFES